MTNADVDPFARALSGMVVAYGQQLEEARLFAYWEGLQDVPIDLVLGAIAEAMRHSEFFPTIAALRKFADDVNARHADASHQLDEARMLPGEVPADARDLGDRRVYACPECRDTGFVDHVCSPAQPLDDRCGSPLCFYDSYAPHRYMTFCLCRPTNPNFQRQIQAKKRFRREA